MSDFRYVGYLESLELSDDKEARNNAASIDFTMEDLAKWSNLGEILAPKNLFFESERFALFWQIPTLGGGL